MQTRVLGSKLKLPHEASQVKSWQCQVKIGAHFMGLTRSGVSVVLNLYIPMKKLFEDIQEELGKNLLFCALTCLELLLLAYCATLKWLGLNLSLSDTQISTIRWSLLALGVTALNGFGWPLFFRTRKRLKATEKLLYEAQHPIAAPHFLDEYQYFSMLGLYGRKVKFDGYLCGKCLASQQLVSHVQDLPHGWQCNVCGFVFGNPAAPQPNSPPPKGPLSV
jgi:hypothetical protein